MALHRTLRVFHAQSHVLRLVTIPLPTLLLALALAPFAGAEEIATPAGADELCATAAPEPTPREGSGAEDPLLRARRHRAFSVTRYQRLTDVYSVVLDTTQYGFVPSEPGLLTVAAWQPFALFGGVYELDLGNPPDFSFVVGDPEREAILAGVASDQVLLRLYFHLISLDRPELTYCEVTERGTSRILGRLLAADLVGRQDHQALAHAETERYQWSRVRFGIEEPGDYVAPQPTVTITSTSFSVADLSPAEAETLRAEAEARLMPCYLRGLNQNGRLQGAMVVSLQVDAAGAVSEPAVTIDAIDQPLVTGCVVGALDTMPVPQAAARGYQVRMTVIFRLE